MSADQMLLVLGLGVVIAVAGAIVAGIAAALAWRGARAVNRTLRRLLGDDDEGADDERRQRAARLR